MNGLLPCCHAAIVASTKVPEMGDILSCDGCGDFMRFSVGGWYHVPFKSLDQTEARHLAAQDAGVNLQAVTDGAGYATPPTRSCITCGKVSTFLDYTHSGVAVYVCTSLHPTMVQKGAA